MEEEVPGPPLFQKPWIAKARYPVGAKLKSIVNHCDSSGSFGSMADFQPIAAGVFEKDRVVARPFMIPRAFDIPSSGPDDDLSQPVDLAWTVRPEGDSAFVSCMP